jgi:hypothetical protein
MEPTLLLGPEWFYSINIWTDIFSIIVLSFIAFFITKAYNITKTKKYLVFMFSFYMIVVGFVLKVISNYLAHAFNPNVTGPDFVRNYALSQGYSWLTVIFMSYELLVLVGFYFLYHVYNQEESVSTIVLVTFLLSISVAFSFFINDVFQLNALALLTLISAQYWTNYHKNGHGNSGLLAASFSLIALSQLAFMMANIHPMYYAIAEAVQLIGYLLLLMTFIMVLIHGKKKKEQARHSY